MNKWIGHGYCELGALPKVLHLCALDMYILDGWTGIYADEKFCDEVEQRVSYTMFNVNDVDHAPWT